MAVALPGKLENVLNKTDRINITCPVCKKVFQVSSNWVGEKGTFTDLTCPINKCGLTFKDGKFISAVEKKQKAAAQASY